MVSKHFLEKMKSFHQPENIIVLLGLELGLGNTFFVRYVFEQV